METQEKRTIAAGKAISYGWESVKKDLWYFAGIALVYIAISGVTSNHHGNQSVWTLLGMILSAWLAGGYLKIVLSYQAGQKIPFTTLFTQLKHFWQILGATILLAIIIGFGFILLIVPGVYLALRFQFVVTLIVDKNLSIGAAMTESARLTKGVKMSLLGFNFICAGVMLLGVIALGIGVLFALPLVWLAEIAVYRQLNSTPQPATPVV